MRDRRFWPAVVLLAILCLLRFVLPIVMPAAAAVGFFGSLIVFLLILLWWSFFSKAPALERVIGVLAVVLSIVVVRFFVHESIRSSAFGMTYIMLIAPIMSIAFVLWVLVSMRIEQRSLRLLSLSVVFFAALTLATFRTNGVTSSFDHELVWRWSDTAEERLLSQQTKSNAQGGDITWSSQQSQWAGFRGSQRNGIIQNKPAPLDKPFKEKWRQAIGPGWSSFAVHGHYCFTQEQRGEEELVSCYDLRNGALMWQHADPVRFWESMAGAGPRATPTINTKHIISLGATGVLNVIHASNGALKWSKDLANDLQVETPYWGFSASPIIVDNMVIVAVSGIVAACDLESGSLLWNTSGEAESYSSPQLFTLAGTTQILFGHNQGLISLNPKDGKLLWKYDSDGECIVQPMVLGNDVLFGNSAGFRRLNIKQQDQTWTVTEQWSTSDYIPDFNDFVVHQQHVYGFSGNMLASINLSDGALNWEGERCGGQLILLSEQNTLLVLTEDGHLLQIEAKPDAYKEMNKQRVLSSKTWNHPVLVDNVLLVRNDQEMAAFSWE